MALSLIHIYRPKTSGTENEEDSYKKLYQILKEFLQADFSTLEAAGYYHLSSKLEEAGELLSEATGDILMLMDMVNDLYVLLLCEDHAMVDLEETQDVYKRQMMIWTAVWKRCTT